MNQMKSQVKKCFSFFFTIYFLGFLNAWKTFYQQLSKIGDAEYSEIKDKTKIMKTAKNSNGNQNWKYVEELYLRSLKGEPINEEEIQKVKNSVKIICFF